MTLPVTVRKAVAAAPPRLSAPSHSLLQVIDDLSDLCTAIRLSYRQPQATVLAASIRRHVVVPLRSRVFSHDSTVISASALPPLPPEAESAGIVLTLLHTCLPQDASLSFLSLSGVLDLFHHELEAHPAASTSFEVLRQIWADLLSVLQAHLNRWLSYATVVDEFEQFFITTSTEAPSVVLRNIPAFVSPNLAAAILFAGNTARCNSVLNNRSVLPCAENLRIESHNAFRALADIPMSAQLIFEAACSRWRNIAAHELSSMLPFRLIADKIRHLRLYLLHGDALFWRLVFDDLRANPEVLVTESDGISMEVRVASEKALNRILAVAAADLHSQSTSEAPPDAPLMLQLSSQGDVVPNFSLSTAESKLLAPKASVFCDVFSTTFGTRRVACELRHVFVHLLYVERQIRKEVRCRVKEATVMLQSAFELRRHMMIFVECFEWYIQAEVIQPKFQSLLAMLEDFEDKKGTARTNTKSIRNEVSFYDTITGVYNSSMEKTFRQSFVANEPVSRRLQAIFATCTRFCEFCCELTTDAVMTTELSTVTEPIAKEFSDNVQLLTQIVSHQNKNADSEISSLLWRLRVNESAVGSWYG